MKLDKPAFAVSTKADVLTKTIKKSSQIIAIWIRTGKYKDRFPIIRSTITYEARSKLDAKYYKKRFVSVLSVPKTHTKLSVLRGVSRVQITQLLSYTKRDKLIRTQTHDFDCFRSKRTFLSWKRRGKVIYTLVNRNRKLLGIAWFNKKRLKEDKKMPEIRIYSPARGKKIERKFLEIARKDFDTVCRKLTASKNR